MWWLKHACAWVGVLQSRHVCVSHLFLQLSGCCRVGGREQVTLQVLPCLLSKVSITPLVKTVPSRSLPSYASLTRHAHGWRINTLGWKIHLVMYLTKNKNTDSQEQIDALLAKNLFSVLNPQTPRAASHANTRFHTSLLIQRGKRTLNHRVSICSGRIQKPYLHRFTPNPCTNNAQVHLHSWSS